MSILSNYDSFDNEMQHLKGIVLEATRATRIMHSEKVQTLWSGYGEIKRYFLEGGTYPSVIVKHIRWPEESNHPRGWNTAISHQRKLKSYQVETNWYRHFASQTDSSCKVPQVLDVKGDSNEVVLMMEDLNPSGYHIRLTPKEVSLEDVKNCLTWLANFHATFMESVPEGLWPIGTYWHLETRPDEWKKMENEELKAAASKIDSKLNQAQFQTLVHGDAKLANFCFSADDRVAAVDFQYVGRGCGMKDVAYLISSCFDDETSAIYEEELLSHYFSSLSESWDTAIDFQSVKEEWLILYPYAWADFYRFLDGWSPGHWKMHGYSEKLTQQVLNDLSS